MQIWYSGETIYLLTDLFWELRSWQAKRLQTKMHQCRYGYFARNEGLLSFIFCCCCFFLQFHRVKCCFNKIIPLVINKEARLTGTLPWGRLFRELLEVPVKETIKCDIFFLVPNIQSSSIDVSQLWPQIIRQDFKLNTKQIPFFTMVVFVFSSTLWCFLWDNQD